MPVSDADLHAALSSALGRVVGPAVRRRPWDYSSSVPMERVDVPGMSPLLFKDLTARERPSRPAFMVDPLREVEAYALLPAAADAPACFGSVVGPDRVWLFLELVDGVPLWQAPGLDAWEATARWLARLHALPVPSAEHLLRWDEQHLLRFLDRALAAHPGGELDGVAPAALRAAALLSQVPPSLIHGELYPSNVLVQPTADGPRVRPVDWETAGIGPGVLDLAALTSGAWAPEDRERVVAAYRDEAAVVPADFDATLEAARLFVALQWLGWSPDWTPPPEHRHDWVAEARRAAARIAP